MSPRLTNHIQAFIYYVDKYHDEAKRDAKKNLPTIISELEQHKIHEH